MILRPKTPAGLRKTLIDRQNETKVADPAYHAKMQVSELDKTAKRSLEKRKFVTEQLEKDRKEMEHIDDQINRINARYLPLCQNLKENMEKRDQLIATLESCMKEEKRIMGDTISTVTERRLDDSKLLRKMAKLELSVKRGYDLNPESTFYQSEKRGERAKSSKSAASARNILK